jgi:hypothetical protein
MGKARTQKGKGLLALIGLPGSNILTGGKIVQSEEDISKLPTKFFLSKIFARPCPKTPRHGFVESRRVGSAEEALVVLKETLEADPEGEMILCPYIPSPFNVIWSPNLLTVGEGIDGATSGKNTISFPLSGALDILTPGYLKKGEITDTPYIEAVYVGRNNSGGNYNSFSAFPLSTIPILTQLRNGPKLEQISRDYIPEDVEVKEIISPNMEDLMEWEKRIKGLEGKEGVVIYHPNGSPLDHYSVHARTFSIPVITSREVKVGDKLEKQKGKTEILPALVLEGLTWIDTFKIKREDCASLLHLSLMTNHLCGVMTGEFSQWVGVAAGIMIRLGTMALRGEARHIRQQHKPMRDQVYTQCMNHSLRRHRASIPRLIHTLRYGNFGGTSVGGIKWAQCGMSVKRLLDAVADLAKEGAGKKEVGELIRALNVAINQAHNGGWWMNKFSASAAFNLAQRGNPVFAIELGPIIYWIGDHGRRMEQPVVERKIATYRTWGPIILRSPRITKSVITLLPGVAGLGFNVEDRILKNRRRPVVVSMENLIDILPHVMKGKIYAVQGEKGARIEIRAPHEDPIILFEDQDLKTQDVPPKELG